MMSAVISFIRAFAEELNVASKRYELEAGDELNVPIDQRGSVAATAALVMGEIAVALLTACQRTLLA